ncbi:MAG: hypothetical protein KC621_16065 [Myxococcales bacterium]|nr:hypothetical protein [Myxococcales bacterium]
MTPSPAAFQVQELRIREWPLLVGVPVVDGRPVDGASAYAIGVTSHADDVPGAVWPTDPIAAARIEADWIAGLEARGARPRWSRVSEAWWWDGATLAPTLAVDVGLTDAAWRWWIDVRDGRPVHGERRTVAARGRVYPSSPFGGPAEVVTLQGLVSADALVGTYVEARSCDAWTLSDSLFGVTSCEATSHHAHPDAAGDYLFAAVPASPRDPMAEVGVYHHVDEMAAWLDAVYGLRLPYAPIRANVNFPMANAFFGDFDGDGVPELSFGTDEETGTDFAYDADVVRHELGHAVVALLAPALPFMGADEVGMDWSAGAVNEGTADIFAMIGSGDPLVGEYAGSAFGEPAIRDLSAPRRCPDDLRGEVHADGEVLAAFGWALISDPAVGADRTADLLFGAIPRYVPDTSWPTVGRAFRDAADDLLAMGVLDAAGHAAVLGHLEAANLEGCGRVVPIDDGAERRLFLVTAGLLGPLERLPAGVQLSIEVPTDAVGVDLRLSDLDGVDGMGWTVFGRVGEPVEHEVTDIPGLGLGFAVPEVWDWAVDGQDDTVLRVGAGEVPLVAGQTLYLTVASRNLGTLLPFDFQLGAVSVAAEVERAAEEPGTCATPVKGPTWPWLPLLLTSWRRRRRAPPGTGRRTPPAPRT